MYRVMFSKMTGPADMLYDTESIAYSEIMILVGYKSVMWLCYESVIWLCYESVIWLMAHFI